MKNNSPWLHQLHKDREPKTLKADLETQVAIVGGGIAGVATAFFTLRNTDKKVVLVEGGKLGHGATGHNGGHITANFERPFSEMVKEFGLSLAAEAVGSVESAWELLELMYREGGLDIPLARFNGCIGFESELHVNIMLEDNFLRRKAGLRVEEILIVENLPYSQNIDARYEGLYKLAPHEEILKRLETHKQEFIALFSNQAGVMNSALFTEEIALYLLEKYPRRFNLYEHTHINKVVLHEDCAILDADIHTVRAQRIVLCTNGFENFEIFNKSGLDINTSFHHLVSGYIGYMSAYLAPLDKPPTTLIYFTDPDSSIIDPYFYLTRRMYEYNDNKHNLISVGGPEIPLEDRREYEKDHEYPERAKESIDAFVQDVYDASGESINYVFTWHGLMGYTPNGVRLVGTEPKNSILLYNLGCNGIGILPSIFGGERIAKLINGENLPLSIFDPKA